MPPIPFGRAALGVALGFTNVLMANDTHASVPPSGGWEVVDISPVNVAGVPVSLSPDGAWLAGTAADDRVCVWAVADLAETCTGEVDAIDPESIAWAPDSSAIAFSTRAFVLLVDSDIQVLDVATGELTNVTDDGFDDRLELGADPTTDPVPIDVMPAWTPDSDAIVFSRALWNGDSDRVSTDIMTLPRSGGEPTQLATIDQPYAVFTPMRVLDDGSVLYSVLVNDPADPESGIWHLDPEGTTTQIVPGGESEPFPGPVITDVWNSEDGYTITGFSLPLASAGNTEADIAFTWSSSGGLTALAPLVSEPGAFVWSGALSPDGATVAQIAAIPGSRPAIELVGPANSTTALPEGESNGNGIRARHPIPTWADNDTIFLPSVGPTSAVLVSVDPT